MTQHYVLIFAKKFLYDSFIAVKKHRPKWQAGRINLPGGHVEDGEDPEHAAVRELEEETGYSGENFEKMGEITGKAFVVHCYRCTIDVCGPAPINPREGETERPHWTSFYAIKDDPRLMPNLQVIIPLMLEGVKGWSILDDTDSTKNTTHGFIVNVPSSMESFAHEVV